MTDSNSSATSKYYERFDYFNVSQNDMAEAKKEFLEKYSSNGEYGYDGQIESLVANELQDRLDNKVFFDYTANGVYLNSQIEQVFNDLKTHFYANSHSQNDFSSRTDSSIEEVRHSLLKRFNVSSSEYTVVFTANATAALKLIGESFPWTNNSTFKYLRQNHNSVLGIREYAIQQGGSFESIPVETLNSCDCEKIFDVETDGVGVSATRSTLTEYPEDVYNLFAFPAMENFTGVKYPLEWINNFHKNNTAKNNNWLVLLDAAAYLSSNDLDLKKYPADFVVMSFYKIVGYPTGLGALIVKNDVLDIMQKSFFGGGTVVMSDCDTHFCLLHDSGYQRFEDGSQSFLAIRSLKYGFDVLDRFGVKVIQNHVMSVIDYLYDELSKLQHSTGKNVVEIYGCHYLKDHSKQGPIINLSVFDEHGDYVGYSYIQSKTNEAGFQIRTGSSCNPGACYGYLGVTSEEVAKFSQEKTACGDENDIIEGKPLGGVRISLGIMSTFEEAYAFVHFFKSNFVN
ncbi:Molybdenum cofactor sulfurase [Entamoeba marina]